MFAKTLLALCLISLAEASAHSLHAQAHTTAASLELRLDAACRNGGDEKTGTDEGPDDQESDTEQEFHCCTDARATGRGRPSRAVAQQVLRRCRAANGPPDLFPRDAIGRSPE